MLAFKHCNLGEGGSYLKKSQYILWMIVGLEPHNSTRNINVGTFTFQQMPSHYSSFDEHSSFLSKHYNLQKQSILTYLISSSPLKFGIWQEIWNTFRRLTLWRNPTKFVVLKHFGWDVLHKEHTTHYYLHVKKCVLCRLWVWSMCRNLSGNTAENDGNTLWKLHRAWRKPRHRISRYKAFWMRIFERTTFLLLRCCSIHVKLCVLETYSAGNWD